jgi:GntR family transcriptional regulator
MELRAGSPAYRQIVDALRAVLVQGGLRTGERLPPVRQVALDLGVHFNTVAQAYRALAAEGWLDLRRRRGARVLARVAPQPSGETAEAFARRLREVLAEWRAAGVPAALMVRELRTAAEGLRR